MISIMRDTVKYILKIGEKWKRKMTFLKAFYSPDKVLQEFTVTSVILGMILAVIFGSTNAYLRLELV